MAYLEKTQEKVERSATVRSLIRRKKKFKMERIDELSLENQDTLSS